MLGRVTVLRPGLIVGPEDNTDRFTYWPARIARGGEVLAPNSPKDPVQFIDVRDLAAFALHCMEQRERRLAARNQWATESTAATIYNVVSGVGQYTIGAVLAACRKAAKTDASLTWVPAAFLDEQKVEGWSDMPVWVHAVDDEAGFALTSNKRGLKAGLRVRAVADTVRDTLAWHLSRPPEQREPLKTGISPQREREVLAAWHARPSKE